MVDIMLLRFPSLKYTKNALVAGALLLKTP